MKIINLRKLIFSINFANQCQDKACVIAQRTENEENIATFDLRPQKPKTTNSPFISTHIGCGMFKRILTEKIFRYQKWR